MEQQSLYNFGKNIFHLAKIREFLASISEIHLAQYD